MSDEVILHLHIPKVGGTTLRSVLYEMCAKENSTDKEGFLRAGIYYFPWGVVAPPDPVVPEDVRGVLGRDDLRAVLGHFWFGIHEHVRRPSTYITLLREPADRLMSLYFLFVMLPDLYNFPLKTSFHEFVTGGRYRETYNDQTRRIAGREPGPGDGGRAVLEQAKENLRRFSVVGTMERFDETLVLLKQRFNWQKPLGYYSKRQNPGRAPVESLPSRTLDAIRELNALDYELYDFAQTILRDEITNAGPTFEAELNALHEEQLARHERMAWAKTAKNQEKKGSDEAAETAGDR